MKQFKKLTAAQKKLAAKRGLIPADYMFICEAPDGGIRLSRKSDGAVAVIYADKPGAFGEDGGDFFAAP